MAEAPPGPSGPASLHPRVAGLIGGWSALSPIQAAAMAPLLERRHALLLAPTGHGKTEAAMLPVLHHLMTEGDRLRARGDPWPAGFKALYVTPLRALNRDLLRRLEGWCETLEMRIGVRHGDTRPAERARQARDPPDILITTPETLQLLLYGDTLRRHLATVRFVVVDEVHDLAQNERGAQLAVALERLEEVIGQPRSLRATPARERICPSKTHARAGGGFQRIGLSATVADDAATAAFLGGTGRDVAVVRAGQDKQMRLDVVYPDPTPEDEKTAARLSLPVAAAAQLRAVRRLVEENERVIVFQNTRDAAELLTSRSALLDEEEGRPPLLGLHHGSLSSEHRMDVETAFRDGTLRGLVATSSLELGIDVGAIDHVVQVQSPRSVARLVQRLGRAGHRIGAVSEGTLVSAGPEDHLECLAVAEMAVEGRLEPARIRSEPLVVLANQLVALSNEYADLAPAWCWQVITRAQPFAELDEGMFQACWDALVEAGTVRGSDSGPRRITRSGRARRHFIGHVSLIPDTVTYRVVDEASKRSIGTVDDAYVAAAMHPGEQFVMAGRNWRVLEVEPEARRVRVAGSRELGAIPQWSGQPLPVSFELAQAVARLRGRVAAALSGSHGDGAGDGRAAARLAAGVLSAAALPAAWAPATPPIAAHLQRGLRVATDDVVTLDAGRTMVVACVALGSRGNQALGRLTAALLHQRVGSVVGFEADAYRIHFTVPAGIGPADIESTWRGMDPDTLDLLLAMVVRGQAILKHHLVHVAKHFGAVPPTLDPNRFTKATMEALWEKIALQEETLSRLVHEKFDLEAVQTFLERLDGGAIEVVHQAVGPLSRLSSDEARGLVAPVDDAQLMAAVRRRIEDSDVMLVCTQCRSRLDSKVADIPRKVRCRRCGSQAVACLRPWQEDRLTLLGKQRLSADERRERERILRNGHLMAGFGGTAARCLVARGVGPDTAGRILQKVSDPADPRFWREILQAELEFARTQAFWR